MLLSAKEWTTDTCNDMEDFQKLPDKWKKQNKNKYLLCGSIYIKPYKRHTDVYRQEVNQW